MLLSFTSSHNVPLFKCVYPLADATFILNKLFQEYMSNTCMDLLWRMINHVSVNVSNDCANAFPLDQ